MNLHVKYLLVGGGVASSAAAEEIRVRDARGTMMLISQESIRPYHRPPLSKAYLRGEQKRPQLFTQKADWYDRNSIELRTSRRAVQLDPTRRSVLLDDGQEIGYEKLLIATGGSALPLKLPGADLPNVYALRTVDDADRLQHAIHQAKTAGNRHARGRGTVAVFGHGLLAIELAATLTQMDLLVDLFTGGQEPWQDIAGVSTRKFLSRYLQANGVRLHTSAKPTALEGDGRVQQVILDGSTIRTDLVVAAVGMKVNRDLLHGTDVSVERAILTDAFTRTNVPDIHAAGDCSAIFDPLFEKHRMADHWNHARQTGRLAGSNMAGGEESFCGVTSVVSEFFGLSATAWGEPRLVERHVVRGTANLDDPQFAEIGIAHDGRIAHVVAVHRQGESPDLPELIRQRVQIEGNEERIKDPGVPIEAFLA